MSTALQPEGFFSLASPDPRETDWLWRGYLAAGNATLLISQWKTGKTTLLSVLLTRLHDGRALAGQSVRPARAAIISEENRSLWQLRSRRLDFGPHAQLFCRPFPNSPSFDEWDALMERLLQLKSTSGLELVIIDTLAPLLPRGVENSADSLLRVLRPLDRLTEAGMAVLLVHHPRKGSVLAGQAARGSGALTGYVDIVVEMDLYSRHVRSDRRRRLSSWSRHSETPTDLVIELNAEGNDYAVCDDVDEELMCNLAIVSRLINERGEQMTRADLQARWPERPRPSKATFWRHLEAGVVMGKLDRHGAGHWQDPFRYTLPGSNLPSLGGVEDKAG